jgi:hypothetical protein
MTTLVETCSDGLSKLLINCIEQSVASENAKKKLFNIMERGQPK